MSLYETLKDLGGNNDGKIYGVMIGIVTNNKDPDGMGRVKLKFPLRGTEDESNWTRVVSFMAGKEMGAFFLPEVEDEVLVAFENGDIEHPYVIGSLWNGEEAPPETNSDGKNNIKTIKSRSGHEITFNDEDSKEQIVIKTKAGHAITLDDSSGSEKIEIKDKSDSNKITIDSAKDAIDIECKADLSIKGKKIEITSDASMTLEAGGEMTIKGTTVKIN
jgi:uncharacterized protein involved in type VI secretion and phage assembly